MGDSRSFEHIKVTPAADDVVIHAGIGPSSDAEAPDAAVSAVPEDASARDGAAPAAPEDASARDGAERAASASVDVVPAYGNDAAPAPSARHAGEAEKSQVAKTALDDLDAAPMPIAQKIVIIAAIVLIIGALVYYFVAMR